MPEVNQTEEENKEEMEEGEVGDTEQVDKNTEQEEIAFTQNEQTLEGKELGLKIFTSKSTGWPKSTLTLKHITEGMYKGTYKYTYTYLP